MYKTVKTTLTKVVFIYNEKQIGLLTEITFLSVALH